MKFKCSTKGNTDHHNGEFKHKQFREININLWSQLMWCSFNVFSLIDNSTFNMTLGNEWIQLEKNNTDSLNYADKDGSCELANSVFGQRTPDWPMDTETSMGRSKNDYQTYCGKDHEHFCATNYWNHNRHTGMFYNVL